MNQKVVIYIILSVILLYLYYRKQDLAIFAAFVVMVAGTLFASKREGFGFGSGGGSKGDKACAKLGFITPKIDKKDINGGLEKTLKNFKKVIEKYADVGGEGIDLKKIDKEIKTINTLFQPDSDATLIRHEWEKASGDDLGVFIQTSFMIFSPYIFRPSEKDQKEIIKDLPRIKERIKKIINGGNMTVKFLEDIKKLDEMKKLDKNANTVLDVIICAFKQVVLIWKSLDKAIGGGGGDDDDEEKSNNKKKSTKKSKKDDEGDEDGEEE